MIFGLGKEVVSQINSIFAKYPLIKRVVIYGSRAKGNYKNGSDIDLTIIGDIDFSLLQRIDNEIDDLLLPYTVDLSVYSDIQNIELIEHIKRVGKDFYKR